MHQVDVAVEELGLQAQLVEQLEVLVRDRGLRHESQGNALVVGVVLVADQGEPAIALRRGLDGEAEARRAFEIIALVMPASHEPCSVYFHDAVPGGDDVARSARQDVEDVGGAALRGDLQLKVDQRSRAHGHGLHAIEFARRGQRQRLAERAFDRLQDHLRLGGLHQHMRHAALLGDALRHGRVIARGVEDDRQRGQLRVGAQPPHELDAVHARHHDVDDGEIGPPPQHDLQSLQAVNGLARLETLV